MKVTSHPPSLPNPDHAKISLVMLLMVDGTRTYTAHSQYAIYMQARSESYSLCTSNSPKLSLTSLEYMKIGNTVPLLNVRPG